MIAATNHTKKHVAEGVRYEFRDELDAYRLSSLASPPSARLVNLLVGCGDILSGEYCELLDLPHGITYGDAAAFFQTDPQHVVVDLHGCSVTEALGETIIAVREAWEQEKRWVTLIHGAPDIRHWKAASVLGRGGIKWVLRGMLFRGELDQYVFGRRSARHRIEDGAMTLAVRPKNPV